MRTLHNIKEGSILDESKNWVASKLIEEITQAIDSIPMKVACIREHESKSLPDEIQKSSLMETIQLKALNEMIEKENDKLRLDPEIQDYKRKIDMINQRIVKLKEESEQSAVETQKLILQVTEWKRRGEREAKDRILVLTSNFKAWEASRKVTTPESPPIVWVPCLEPDSDVAEKNSVDEYMQALEEVRGKSKTCRRAIRALRRRDTFVTERVKLKNLLLKLMDEFEFTDHEEMLRVYTTDI